VVDEQILLAQASHLDQAALTQIHDLYYTAVYRNIAFRVSNPQTVEDLTNEVFTRFLSAIRDKNAPKNTIRGWLLAVSNNIVKEYYRQNKRDNWVEFDDLTIKSGRSPAEQVHWNLEKEELHEAIQTLTEEQQQVLAMRFGFEMPIREVATSLNKSEGSIKMLQARAISGLTQILRGKEMGA
jgi:RNA polymerase sigma-70 factor (ECF subfamily)